MVPLWIGFFVLVLALLALDLGVFNKDGGEMSTASAVRWTIAWIGVGVAFGAFVYFVYENHWFGAGGSSESLSGGDAVSLYFTAYVLEKSLSVDNIFVISFIFSGLNIAPEHQRRVLFWGIIGALVFRTIMIGGGVWLIEHFAATFYIFGAILVFSGLRMLISSEEAEGEQGWFVRGARKLLPIADGDYGDRFRARVDGKLMLTQLSLALIAIELTDVVFAFDSVPAVLAISSDPFIVVTSNVFAILGLRSLYFVLASMMNRFHYLEIALSILLILIGAKLFAHNFVHIPNKVSLLTVLGVVGLGVGASLLTKPKPKPEAGED
jgi:tellurite resistance protein TerC